MKTRAKIPRVKLPTNKVVASKKVYNRDDIKELVRDWQKWARNQSGKFIEEFDWDSEPRIQGRK